jgi:quinol-cytochrome oxidoreductase complex cytochrome b subunit
VTRAARVVVWSLLAVAFVFLLFTVVFPWFDRTFVTDPVLDSRAGAGRSPVHTGVGVSL